MKNEDQAGSNRPSLPTDSPLDDFWQLFYPLEFRIAVPDECLLIPTAVQPTNGASSPRTESPKTLAPHVVAELATAIWYLKCKHFKRAWDDLESSDDDPRVRRTLGRLNKSLTVLEEAGVEINDPTNQRYPQGGEGMMRPVQFLPTAGISHEMVAETMSPIVYLDGQLIQRGEVFVAVPKEEAQPSLPTEPPLEASPPAHDGPGALDAADGADGAVEPSDAPAAPDAPEASTPHEASGATARREPEDAPEDNASADDPTDSNTTER